MAKYERADVRDLLAELVAVVRGECPSLLNEDSGGDAELALAIDRVLAAPPVSAPERAEGMPPVEIGDWVCIEGRGVHRVIRIESTDVFFILWPNSPHYTSDVTEQRKADGRVWRRAARKEPTS